MNYLLVQIQVKNHLKEKERERERVFVCVCVCVCVCLRGWRLVLLTYDLWPFCDCIHLKGRHIRRIYYFCCNSNVHYNNLKCWCLWHNCLWVWYPLKESEIQVQFPVGAQTFISSIEIFCKNIGQLASWALYRQSLVRKTSS